MIRKRRLDLGLRQIDAAKMIGCEEMSVVNWEKGATPHASITSPEWCVFSASIPFRMVTLWRIDL